MVSTGLEGGGDPLRVPKIVFPQRAMVTLALTTLRCSFPEGRQTHQAFSGVSTKDLFSGWRLDFANGQCSERSAELASSLRQHLNNETPQTSLKMVGDLLEPRGLCL